MRGSEQVLAELAKLQELQSQSRLSDSDWEALQAQMDTLSDGFSTTEIDLLEANGVITWRAAKAARLAAEWRRNPALLSPSQSWAEMEPKEND